MGVCENSCIFIGLLPHLIIGTPYDYPHPYGSWQFALKTLILSYRQWPTMCTMVTTAGSGSDNVVYIFDAWE